KRLNDLDSLERIAGRYSSLEDFLSDMALEPPEKSLITPGRKDTDDAPLTLSTIHSAKGLEWHTVFVIYVAEGHLPSYLSLEDQDALEEERRLLYVAVTRAKENLYLLKPHIDRSPRSYFDDAGSVFTRVSRFLEEGDILSQFLEYENTHPHPLDEDSWDDFKEVRQNPDQEFLKMLKEYYRNP
ncbi:MAG: ATP-binding domain-containing protein, partial [Candidatus Omnitrophica bacterium]|nr:ATP-binding domain-containing protein [Candidatus Omnitrophota bacterium]